jgi:hypothetical protein
MTPETSILDAALRVRPEMPFSCKGGMCATCKGRIEEGEVSMTSKIFVTDFHFAGPDANSLSFPWEILQEQDTIDRLTSPTHSKIHGDLHFDNILVDPYFPEEPIFVLIDPRGGKSGDPACDIGKLMFSCQAGYDFVGTGNFDVNVKDAPSNECWVSVDLPSSRVVHRGLGGGASAAGLVSIGRSLPRTAQDLYQHASDMISQTAASLAREKLGDDKLMDRSTFYMGLFCLVTAENHYLQNPDGALALLTRGCRIIEKWKTKAK